MQLYHAAPIVSTDARRKLARVWRGVYLAELMLEKSIRVQYFEKFA